VKSKVLETLLFAAGLAAVFPLAAEASPISAATCEAMAGRAIPASAIGLPTRGVKITAARLVPATTGGAPAGPSRGPPGARLPNPDHCRIEGAIAPVDPTAPNIEFALAVPLAWNGDSWHLGGGGVNGFVSDLGGAGAMPTPGAPSLLSQGYAVYASDSGHQGIATDWVRNEESWRNFAYEQLKKTHDATDAALQALTGGKPRRHYFAGGSQGGREGLEVISRYGADYDGVLAQVPLGYFQGLLIDPTLKVLAQTAPGAWIPPSKFPAITAAIQAACDGLDGLNDGVISAVVACNRKLDPTVTPSPLSDLRCASGRDEGDACLSTEQLAMLNSLHAPVKWPYRLPNGFSDWPGWAAGADTNLLSRTRPDPSKGEGLFGIGAGVQRQLFGGSADFNLYKFDVVTYRPRLERLSRELDVPPDWSAFLRHGGKLVWVSGAADIISNPRSQMRLYDEVVKKNGKTAVDAGVRYYVLPMGDHGLNSRSATGQPMPSAWNPAGALRDWVEQGVAPADAPVLATYSGETITATRPMCRYPAYPQYVAGSPTWATAFSCRTAPPR
jgi:feruloyl esterase